ncbi:MAG: hypothetical protein ACLVAW_18630, partial [Eisenbergiella massiliensis]
IWYFLFAFMPMFGIIIAFKDYKIKGGFLQSIIQSDWIGFQNFKFLFSAGDIWIILRNTILYNIAFIILNIVVPVTMALLIGQLHNKKMAKVYQTAMFMPYFLSWVVVTAVTGCPKDCPTAFWSLWARTRISGIWNRSCGRRF